jgi:hypothetical protein
MVLSPVDSWICSRRNTRQTPCYCGLFTVYSANQPRVTVNTELRCEWRKWPWSHLLWYYSLLYEAISFIFAHSQLFYPRYIGLLVSYVHLCVTFGFFCQSLKILLMTFLQLTTWLATEFYPLGCNALQSGRSPLTWRRSVPPPYSGSKSKWSNSLARPPGSCWFLAWYTLRLWRWRQYFPSKRQWTSTGLHCVTWS